MFWPAFAAAGMLKNAQVELGDGSVRPVQVGFETPDMLDLGGRVTTADYRVEYQTADMPELARGSMLEIDGTRYRVRHPPRRKDDGYFSVADLEKAV
ncbi:head-tail joining protein [Paraburkholderia caribensis]|uniref:head-tail joining protein n=1 Tax=Paraburkholderia caribensis TaxID=75105 RepID=UPI001F376B34|nr:hypothetical protein [Paraburkholderia caribensis]